MHEEEHPPGADPQRETGAAAGTAAARSSFRRLDPWVADPCGAGAAAAAPSRVCQQGLPALWWRCSCSCAQQGLPAGSATRVVQVQVQLLGAATADAPARRAAARLDVDGGGHGVEVAGDRLGHVELPGGPRVARAPQHLAPVGVRVEVAPCRRAGRRCRRCSLY